VQQTAMQIGEALENDEADGVPHLCSGPRRLDTEDDREMSR